MKLLFTLPNGAELNLLDEGPNGMEYICLVCGEFKTPISELLEIYKQETNNFRRQAIADEIRDQAYFLPDKLALLMKNSSK